MDYGYQHDSHVFARAYHQAVERSKAWPYPKGQSLPQRFDPEDWSRYDGELL